MGFVDQKTGTFAPLFLGGEDEGQNRLSYSVRIAVADANMPANGQLITGAAVQAVFELVDETNLSLGLIARWAARLIVRSVGKDIVNRCSVYVSPESYGDTERAMYVWRSGDSVDASPLILPNETALEQAAPYVQGGKRCLIDHIQEVGLMQATADSEKAHIMGGGYGFGFRGNRMWRRAVMKDILISLADMEEKDEAPLLTHLEEARIPSTRIDREKKVLYLTVEELDRFVLVGKAGVLFAGDFPTGKGVRVKSPLKMPNTPETRASIGRFAMAAENAGLGDAQKINDTLAPMLLADAPKELDPNLAIPALPKEEIKKPVPPLVVWHSPKDLAIIEGLQVSPEGWTGGNFVIDVFSDAYDEAGGVNEFFLYADGTAVDRKLERFYSAREVVFGHMASRTNARITDKNYWPAHILSNVVSVRDVADAYGLKLQRTPNAYGKEFYLGNRNILAPRDPQLSGIVPPEFKLFPDGAAIWTYSKGSYSFPTRKVAELLGIAPVNYGPLREAYKDAPLVLVTVEDLAARWHLTKCDASAQFVHYSGPNPLEPSSKYSRVDGFKLYQSGYAFDVGAKVGYSIAEIATRSGVGLDHYEPSVVLQKLHDGTATTTIQQLSVLSGKIERVQVHQLAEKLGLKPSTKGFWWGPNPFEKEIGFSRLSGFSLNADGTAFDMSANKTYSVFDVARLAGLSSWDYAPAFNASLG